MAAFNTSNLRNVPLLMVLIITCVLLLGNIVLLTTNSLAITTNSMATSSNSSPDRANTITTPLKPATPPDRANTITTPLKPETPFTTSFPDRANIMATTLNSFPDRAIAASVPKSKARICRHDEKMEDFNKYDFQSQVGEDRELVSNKT